MACPCEIQPNRGEAIRQAVLGCREPSVLLITGKGDFNGTAKTTLRIVDTSSMTSMSKVKVTKKIAEQVYTAGGNRLDEEMVVLKHGTNQLAAGTDYEFVQHEYNGAARTMCQSAAQESSMPAR